MLFLKIYRFFVGKVRIAASGDFVERLLNLCAYNGISVWGIRKRNNKLTLYMSVSDFKRLHTVVRGNGIRLHILRKRGMPFIVNRYRYRYGIAVGAALFFVMLQFLSGFIWNINVSGNKNVDTDVIKQACREIGIYEGARASDINAWSQRVVLQTRVDGLAWAALNIEGCELVVDVTEAPVNEKRESAPCNLLASNDGLVKKIEVTSGAISVAVGDVVTKDSLLVSGVVELSNGNTHFVHSSGKIIAEVSETFSATVPYKQTIIRLSDDSSIKYVLDFFGLRVPLYFGSTEGEYISKYSKHMISSSNSYVPIYLHRAQITTIKEETVQLSQEDAVNIARKNLEERLRDIEIISKTEEIVGNDQGVTVKYKTVLLKDIAKTEILLINATN